MGNAADRYASLALHCRRAGRPEAAAALVRLGLAERPADAALWRLQGGLALDRRAPAEARGVLARAHRLAPDDAEMLSALGAALEGAGEGERAVAAHARVAALAPGEAEALYGLANTLHGLGRRREAEPWYRAAVRLAPGLLKGHVNLGLLLVAEARLEAAITAFRTALALAPALSLAEEARVRWNLALALLLAGRLAEGWEEYEWRWREPTFPSPARDFPQPQWRGEALEGRTILLHAEQGMGDVLHFVRYAPLVAARGGRVVLEVHGPLERLLAGIEGVERVVARGAPLPPFALQCPLLSLPRAFATTLATIPAVVPYLKPDPALVARWGARLAAAGGEGPRVGLVWAGNPHFSDDRTRSPGLAALAPLFAVAGVRFVALQMGEGRRDLDGGPRPPWFLDLGPEIADFADTAAILTHLDLLISSCTAPPLLAGALARPSWIALQRVPDWRWLMEREDSPWYPTLRLFRQTVPGDWAGVFARMAGELARWTASFSPSGPLSGAG